MRRTMLAILGVVLLTACGSSSRPQLTQAQMNALETREVEAGFAETFNAASNALFDAGYTISMSDRQAGLLTGTRVHSRRAERKKAKNPLIEDEHRTVSFQIREVGTGRSAVRIKTALNGEPAVNKRTVDRLWVLMQRQVLMNAPPPVADASRAHQ